MLSTEKETPCIFKFIRNVKGYILGFTVTGNNDPLNESFCMSFPTAVRCKKARISLTSDGYIVFDHEGILEIESEKELGVYGFSSGGIQMFPISVPEMMALKNILSGTGLYVGNEQIYSHITEPSRGFSMIIRIR